MVDPMQDPRGCVFIVSAPSGAGKSSLVAALLAAERNLRLSISFTTRAPRVSDRDGVNYHFINREPFLRMAEAGEFLESAEVYGNLYGTSHRWIRDTMASGNDVVLEIDWQGAAQVRRLFPGTVGIFILPPSLAVLKNRLESRAQDSPEVITRRLAAAREDISHLSNFDYVIINNDFSEAVKDLTGIVRAERCKLARQVDRCTDLFN
jgi:guanylate kinase